MSERDAALFTWTSLFPARSGLPETVWVSATGLVATDPYRPDDIEHAEAVFALVALNRPLLTDRWRGTIDGAEMAARATRLP